LETPGAVDPVGTLDLSTVEYVRPDKHDKQVFAIHLLKKKRVQSDGAQPARKPKAGQKPWAKVRCESAQRCQEWVVALQHATLAPGQRTLRPSQLSSLKTLQSLEAVRAELRAGGCDDADLERHTSASGTRLSDERDAYMCATLVASSGDGSSTQTMSDKSYAGDEGDSPPLDSPLARLPPDTTSPRPGALRKQRTVTNELYASSSPSSAFYVGQRVTYSSTTVGKPILAKISCVGGSATSFALVDVKTEGLIQKDADISKLQAVPINAPGKWDIMISYSQGDDGSGWLAEVIDRELEKRHKNCWLDLKMDHKDEAAMEEGAKRSQCLVAIVCDDGLDDDTSTAYFRRKFCLKELRWAKEAGVKIQPIVRFKDKEKISALLETIPEDLHALSEIDWIPVDHTDKDYLKVGIDKILKAADCESESQSELEQEPEPEPESEPRR
jgi:hypothetical protein